MLTDFMPKDEEIALCIGAAIANQDPDALKSLGLDGVSLKSVQKVWRRIETVFTPAERHWFRQACKGEVYQGKLAPALLLRPNRRFIPLSDLDGISVQCRVYRQTDGTFAILDSDLPGLAIDCGLRSRERWRQQKAKSQNVDKDCPHRRKFTQ